MLSKAIHLKSGLFPANPFPHNKILEPKKWKAFADGKLKVTKMIISVFDRVENIVKKRRTFLYKQFLLFPQCFQKAFSQTRQKVSLCGNGLKVKIEMLLAL